MQSGLIKVDYFPCFHHCRVRIVFQRRRRFSVSGTVETSTSVQLFHLQDAQHHYGSAREVQYRTRSERRTKSTCSSDFSWEARRWKEAIRSSTKSQETYLNPFESEARSMVTATTSPALLVARLNATNERCASRPPGCVCVCVHEQRCNSNAHLLPGFLENVPNVEYKGTARPRAVRTRSQ